MYEAHYLVNGWRYRVVYNAARTDKKLSCR